MDKCQAVVKRALELVGCGYIYGATGWVCTQKRLDQQAKQYPNQANNIYKYGPKWMGKKCFDCAQLTKTVYAAIGISLPSGATSQWTKGKYLLRGRMDTFPADIPGVQLFKQGANISEMDHTGISLGDGTFTDARGHAYGVLHSPISSYKWTHWALPDVLEDKGQSAPDASGDGQPTASATPTPPIGAARAVVATQKNGLMLRETPDTQGGPIREMPKGSTVRVLEPGGEWTRVWYVDENGTPHDGWCFTAYLQFTD